MTGTWRAQNAAWLTTSLQRLRLRMERFASSSDRTSAGRGESVDRLGDRLRELEQRMAVDVGRPALRVLAELAGLSAQEEELLLVAAAPALDGGFARLCAELQDDIRLDYPTPQLAFALLVDPPDRLDAADLLLPHGTLRLRRLIDLADDHEQPLLLRRLFVDDRMADFLRGVNRLDSALEPFLRPVPESLDEVHAEIAGAQVVAMLEQDVDHWPTLNLVGAADAGAAEVVSRACAALGLRPWQLDVERLALQDPVERAACCHCSAARLCLAGWRSWWKGVRRTATATLRKSSTSSSPDCLRLCS